MNHPIVLPLLTLLPLLLLQAILPSSSGATTIYIFFHKSRLITLYGIIVAIITA